MIKKIIFYTLLAAVLGFFYLIYCQTTTRLDPSAVARSERTPFWFMTWQTSPEAKPEAVATAPVPQPEQTKPAQPTPPAQPAQPAPPDKKTQPSQPTQQAQSTQPAQPAQPAQSPSRSLGTSNVPSPSLIEYAVHGWPSRSIVAPRPAVDLMVEKLRQQGVEERLKPLAPAPELTAPPPAPAKAEAQTEKKSRTTKASGKTTEKQSHTYSYVILENSYRREAEANNRVSQLQSAGYPVFVAKAELGSKGVFYRVLFGPFANKEEANQAKEKLQGKPDIKHLLILRHSAID